MTTLREKYINKKSEYIYNSYFRKSLLTAKYFNLFGKYEIEKMSKIYDVFRIDQKFEQRFNHKFFMALQDKPMDYNSEIYSEAIFKSEYKDLENQILTTKNSISSSRIKIDRIQSLIDNGAYDKIKAIVKKIDTFLNKDEQAITIYKAFHRDMKQGKLNLLDKYYQALPSVDTKAKRPRKETIEMEISSIEADQEKLLSAFPFTEEEAMDSEKSIANKIHDFEEEITKSEESLRRITNLYLFTGDFDGLVN